MHHDGLILSEPISLIRIIKEKRLQQKRILGVNKWMAVAHVWIVLNISVGKTNAVEVELKTFIHIFNKKCFTTGFTEGDHQKILHKYAYPLREKWAMGSASRVTRLIISWPFLFVIPSYLFTRVQDMGGDMTLAYPWLFHWDTVSGMSFAYLRIVFFISTFHIA